MWVGKCGELHVRDVLNALIHMYGVEAAKRDLL